MSPNGCYLRVGSGLKPMDEAMIQNLFASRTRVSLRNIVSPRYGTHNFQQLKIYYQEHGAEITDEFLKNLDLYTSDGKFNMVAYLMADVNSLSVRFAKYEGTDKCDLLETQEFGYCSLLKAMDKLWDKIDVENRTLARITGELRRQETRLVDYTALREAFINAFVHNDYTTEQAPLVEIFSDRITITSYGSLVNELSIDEFFRGRSIPRNRELMRIFHDMDWVEQLGSGMRRILRKYPKEIYEISDHFVVVTFMFADVSQNVAENVLENSAINGVQLTERQQHIYDAITASTPNVQVNGTANGTVNGMVSGTVNALLLSTLLEIPLRTIKRELYFMRDLGLIHRVGSDKTGHWEVVNNKET